MKTVAVASPLTIGVLALAVFLGWYLHGVMDGRKENRTTITIVDVPLFIPGKAETKPARVIRDTVAAYIGPLDTILAKASVDSLRGLVRHFAAPMVADFSDSIDVGTDTTGRFRAGMITTVSVQPLDDDPLQRIITAAHEWRNAIITYPKVQTTTTEYKLDWLLGAIVFLGGIILGMVASL